MSNLTGLNSNDKTKLRQIVEEGIRITQEVDDLKGGLKDTIKAVAEELEIKPAHIAKAIRVAYKASIDAEKSTFDSIEEILHVAGKI